MRTVLVTGATAGFGEAVARRFVGSGDRVIAVARRAERLEALHRELGDAVLPVVLDVTDRGAVGRAIDALPSGWAEVDVLVNNAGLALGIGRAWETDLDEWSTMLATNCFGLSMLTRRLLPGMVARGRGHVVNIGSVAATVPYVGASVYGATKAFVAQFTRNLRIDLVGTRVRVTLIEPAIAETEFSLVRFQGHADRAKAVYEGLTPLSAPDIAEAVIWACAQPPHVNVSTIELYPTAQAAGGFSFHRVNG